LKNSKTFLRGILMLVVAASLIAGCTASPAVPGTGGGATRVRIAVLPILDTLPMYVARQEGLFAKHGVEVELIPAGSAPKRDEMINAGQADGMINEIVSTLFYNRSQTQVQIVRFARTAAPGSPMFRILASGDSGIQSVQDLRGVEIGISQGTVIEYLTDRLLEVEGIDPAEVRAIAVPDIGQRMALLADGQLKAAMLPDPLATLAMQQGAVLVMDDGSHPEYGHSTYAFRKAFIDQNPDAVRGFLAAIEEAVELINREPERWQDLLSQEQLVPAPLAGAFGVPTFVTAGIPTEEQWNDVLEWTQGKGLIQGSVSYSDSVTSEYLP
jgi:NitT/TauT family transport system substrate-binding protein